MNFVRDRFNRFNIEAPRSCCDRSDQNNGLALVKFSETVAEPLRKAGVGRHEAAEGRDEGAVFLKRPSIFYSRRVSC